jgi:hypothetical protein
MRPAVAVAAAAGWRCPTDATEMKGGSVRGCYLANQLTPKLPITPEALFPNWKANATLLPHSASPQQRPSRTLGTNSIPSPRPRFQKRGTSVSISAQSQRRKPGLKLVLHIGQVWPYDSIPNSFCIPLGPARVAAR